LGTGVFFGLLIKAFIPDFDNSPVRSLAAIALDWYVFTTGAVRATRKAQAQLDALSVQDGVRMGLAQALH